MVFYVHRNSEGKVASIHKSRRPKYAEEELPDNDPEVVDIISKANTAEQAIISIEDIYTALVDKGILTKQDITAAKVKRPK